MWRPWFKGGLGLLALVITLLAAISYAGLADRPALQAHPTAMNVGPAIPANPDSVSHTSAIRAPSGSPWTSVAQDGRSRLLAPGHATALPLSGDGASVGDVPEGPVSLSSVSLGPIKDNTLYQDSSGTVSNGAGQYFFVGRTGSVTNKVRRGVIAFGIAGNVPAGSTISSVTLTLNMSKTNFQAGSRTIGLHKLSAAWGEGTSDAPSNEGGGTSATAGDATWLHTFFNTDFWQAAGGDFSATVSASTSVAGEGSYFWGSTAQMVADVQAWLDDPPSNFGWVLVGDESVNTTTKRFDTKENGTPSNRPVLTVDYTPPPPPQAVLQFSAASYSIAENGGSATITVIRTGGSDDRVTVDYATIGGTATTGSDYVGTMGTITFATGDSGNKTFNVTILDDVLLEGEETVNLALSNPTGGAVLGSPDTAVLTITDHEPGSLQFNAASYTVAENGGSATITVIRTGGSDDRVTVDYATIGGTATSGSDYVGTMGTVTFATGDTGNRTFNITILDDVLVEGEETVSLALSNPTGGAVLGSPDTAVMTIIDTDIAEDVDRDGRVGERDLQIIAANLDPRDAAVPFADVNEDGIVDLLDLVLIAIALGRSAL